MSEVDSVRVHHVVAKHHSRGGWWWEELCFLIDVQEWRNPGPSHSPHNHCHHNWRGITHNPNDAGCHESLPVTPLTRVIVNQGHAETVSTHLTNDSFFLMATEGPVLMILHCYWLWVSHPWYTGLNCQGRKNRASWCSISQELLKGAQFTVFRLGSLLVCHSWRFLALISICSSGFVYQYFSSALRVQTYACDS